MMIPYKDIKKLWFLAGGRCSKPDCEEECIKFLDAHDPAIISEMAHVIVRQPAGPQSVPSDGEDTYKNLILLCPAHHSQIDKAPEGIYPVELMHQWKKEREERVSNSFSGIRYSDRLQLAVAIKRLLLRNKSAWEEYGPGSEDAKKNPMSNRHEIWTFRKLDTIVPNNRRIVVMIEKHKRFFEIADYKICALFIEHAKGFERNCYERTEGVPRFPIAFERMIDRYIGIH
jgi:hypothetical protein